MNNDAIIQGDNPPAINYHRIISNTIDPVPSETYASFNCPRGVFRCGDNVLCGDCKGFTEHCQKCERLKALLADVFPVIDNALNYFYPLRSEDGDKAMDARARLFELRDKIKARIKQEGI